MRQQYRSRLLGILQAWLPVLTVVVGALWGLYTYIGSQKDAEALRLAQAKSIEEQRIYQQKEAEQQRHFQVDREAATRRIEAQKPFLTKQLELYFETANVIGRLVTLSRAERSTDSYKDMRKRLYALYWSELAMVEHPAVGQEMKYFMASLEHDEKEQSSQSQWELQVRAVRLSQAIRESIESAWNPPKEVNK